MQTCPPRVHFVRYALLFLGLIVGSFCPNAALAVRPFVTDDARIVYKGQVGTETYGGVTMVSGDKPAFEVRTLESMSITDRFELTAGGFGFTYQDHQARPLDMLIQPKYVLHSSLGAIPSVSVAAATLFPLSGNRQHWDGYAMAHLSWFLFTPDPETDPYDNNLALHFNLGMKFRYDAGPTTFQNKLYWAAGFEVVTPVTRELRFLGEIFNGDPFAYEEKFPAFQTGFRWYKSPITQIDLVFHGLRNGSLETQATTGAEFAPGWDYTIQMGLRMLFDVFR
ncbi:MAG: hypothetical protein JSS39_17740 [Nitrospira sp.]|nr:hypothetical protein [Nitrospira sp.]